MLEHLDTGNILFLDIETVPMTTDYNTLPDNFKKLWDRKAKETLKEKEETTPEQSFSDRAGIYAEFGKIICISVGYVSKIILKIKSIMGDDERYLLQEFTEMLDKHYNNNRSILCGHNAKEFDYP